MKKMLQGRLLLLMVITLLLSAIVYANTSYNAKFSMTNETATVGENIEITLSIESTSDVNGILLNTLEYDENILEFVGFTEYGNLITSSALGASGVDSTTGVITLGYTDAVAPNGKICKLVFKTKASGTSEVSMNGLLSKGGQQVTNVLSPSCTAVVTPEIVTLTGQQTVSVTVPAKGAVPQATIANGTGYTGAISWEGAPSKFVADTVYVANITLTANNWYVFAPSATGNVAGATITNNTVSNDGSKLTFKATFPATAGKDTPVCVAPTGLTATYGQTLADVTISNPAGNTEGTWSWMTPTDFVGNASATPVNFKAKFVPADSANYITVENIDVPVTVNAKNITVSVDTILDQEYTGSQLKPDVTVTGDGKTLVLNTDYTVEYGANVNVGTNAGSVTVKAKANGNYTFEDTVKSFNIVAKAGAVSISGDLNITFGETLPTIIVNKKGSDGDISIYYYTNAGCTDGKTLEKPTNAGNYWVQAEMAAGTNYGAAVSNILSFTISRADITPTVSIAGWEYKSTANHPAVNGNTGNGGETFKYKVKGSSDNTYSLSVPKNAGDYTVKAEVAQTTNYNAGTSTVDFTITPKALTEAMVTDVDAQNYTGSAIKPTPDVADGAALVNNTDFTYTYEDNTYVGTAKVNVVGKGNYCGTITKEFSILAVDQVPAITPTAHVTRGGNTVDLKPLVANAKGEVSFSLSGEANGCTINNGVLTSGENSGTVKINVAITAKDENGDTVNEYNAYSLADAITVTVNDKATQDALNITSAAKVTYGQTLTLTSVGGSGTGAVTYAVTSGTGEATIEGNVLTPIKAGTVTVIATKAEDLTYNAVSSAPVVVTIEKIKVAIPAEDATVYTYNGKEQTYNIAENSAYTIEGNKQKNANETGYSVTVTLNDTDTHAWADDSVEIKNYTFVIKKATITVTAKNKQVYVNGTAPELGAEDYTVTGLAEGEALKTAPTIEYETTPDTTRTGSVVIKVYGAEAPDGGNYNDVVHKNGTFTVKNNSYIVETVTTYTVKFETNGGSEITSKTVNKDAVLEAPEAPTKEGFEFKGWFADEELTSEYDFTSKVTKSFTLYAKWTEIEKEPVVDEPDITITFTDIKEDDWFYASVKFAVENKLMNGIADEEFAPNDTLTRAMLVTILYRDAGEPAVNKSIPFADVDMGAYYANAVIWAKQNGIVNGVTETEFAPDGMISREQIATIIYRYAQYRGYDVSTYEDTDILAYEDAEEISEYAVTAMKYAVGSGLIKGKTATTLNPVAYATRAEIATILQRFIEATK